FNIGNARSAVTILDLAQRVKRLTSAPGEIVFRPLHYADVELRIPNVEKAREGRGFEAKADLDEGLPRTIAWDTQQTPVLSCYAWPGPTSARPRPGAWPRCSRAAS